MSSRDKSGGDLGQPPIAATNYDGQIDPTRWDGASDGTGVPAGGAAGHGYGHLLPPQLAAQGWRLVGDLGSGSESAVFLCTNQQGSRVAVKVYHVGRNPEYEVDLGTDEYLRHFHPDWAVEVYERDGEAGIRPFYEVLEYCPHGTLEDFLRTRAVSDDLAMSIVRRLAHCIKSLQGNPPKMVHGDIKPTNILVRNPDKVELILSDFGLTVNLRDSTRVTNLGKGTAAYGAPEIIRSKGVEADWWSLGMIMYRVLVGRGYYDGTKGALDPTVIERDLVSRDVSLAEIDRIALPAKRRERWKLLLAGLLTRDPRKRWKAQEIEAWMVGRSPAVHFSAEQSAGASADTPSGRTATKPFAFAGVGEFSTTSALGEAMAAHPQEAARMLTARGTPLLLAWLTDDARTCDDYSELVRHNWDPDAKVCYFISKLAPGAPIVFRSRPITAPVDLRNLATKGDTAVINALYDAEQLLDSLQDAPARSKYHMIEANWRDIVEQAITAAATRGITLSDNLRDHLRRQALLLAASDDAVVDGYVEQVRKKVNSPEYQPAREVEWFRNLCRDAGI